MKKKRMWTALTVLLAAVFLISVGMMIRQQIQYRKIIADGNEAAMIAGLQNTPAPRPAESSPSAAPAQPEGTEAQPEPLPDEALHLAGLDLAALRAVNGDVVGWIEIPGTELSYPLVQGTDNQYYLSHNWKKEASIGGSVFLESTSNPDLSGFHTIVYAHRMRNDTMFGTLKYYNALDFWREHPRVYVATADGIYRYDIFAAQGAGIKGIVYRLDIETSHLEEEFLQYCMENSVIDTGIAPEADDRILTLSTCTNSGHATRWVVHGYLTQIYSAEAAG